MNDLDPRSVGAYELTFSEGFKSGLEVMPKEIHPTLDRALRRLESDPFERNLSAKRMQNACDTYTMRIGIHVRMLYRIQSKLRRVEILSIVSRQRVYDREINGVRPLLPREFEELRAEIAGIPRDKTKPQRQPKELPISIETPVWITEDHLHLLRIPRDEWQAVIAAGSIERLQQAAVSATTKLIVEDYLTNPLQTQVEKLYTLGPGQDVASIAQQPLSHFLVALDPEQRQALKRIKTDGPYLLKGSAGTGKSLVGLYHIRDEVMARKGGSLLESKEAEYGVITYTNALVDTNQALLQSVTPGDAHSLVRSTTLDKIANELARRVLGRAPSPLDTDGVGKWIEEYVIPKLPQDMAAVLARLGSDYVATEIEQVIHGNGVPTLENYMTVERRGRKRGLRDDERRSVWAAYEIFRQVCEERKVQTFGQLRILALQYLKANPDYPRFGALFVDEAQDLSRVARQLCLELVRDPRNLLLAADTGQSIYMVPPSWRQTDPLFDFRRRRPILLERSYRATREIGEAIAQLRMDPGDDEDSCKNASPVFTGPKPKWIQAPLAKHAGVICDEIVGLIGGENPVNPSQIAVIVRDRSQANGVKAALKSLDIGATVVAKGSPLQINGEKVHILTAHSSKGLGFPIVLVPYVHKHSYPSRFETEKAKDADQRAQIEENEQRLLYVALSRASYRLVMVVDTDEPSPFVAKLNREAHWS